MWLTLMTNWKLFIIGGAILAVFSSGWYVESQFSESRLERALKEQQISIEKACDDNKKLTEENSRAYENQTADLTRKLADYRKLHPSRCVMPVAGKATGSAGTAPTTEHVGQNGVNTDALIEYSGTCEKLRLQVISLQEFINHVWKEKV